MSDPLSILGTMNDEALESYPGDHSWRSPEDRKRAIAERVARELDPRLADVWLEMYTCDFDDEVLEQLGWFVRMAYVQGFADAREGQRPSCLSMREKARRKGGGRR
jgi:hypothetical protein